MGQFKVVLKAIIRKDGLILALQRPIGANSASGLWDLPGGKMEYGEEMLAALQREVFEETGLNINIHSQPITVWGEASHTRATHYVGITMLADYTGGDVKLSAEHVQYKWMKPSEFIGLAAFPILRAEVQKYLAAHGE